MKLTTKEKILIMLITRLKAYHICFSNHRPNQKKMEYKRKSEFIIFITIFKRRSEIKRFERSKKKLSRQFKEEQIDCERLFNKNVFSSTFCIITNISTCIWSFIHLCFSTWHHWKCTGDLCILQNKIQAADKNQTFAYTDCS